MGGTVSGIGARVREHRVGRGLRQAAVARRAGISASYLALIEQGRRPVRGPLLDRLAAALEASPEALAGKVDAARLDALHALAAEAGLDRSERDGAEEMLRRHPAWADLLLATARAAARDADRAAALADRLAHDPRLADAAHELLTSTACVRSLASILAGTPSLEAAWLKRFHGGLDAEARRLAASVEAVVALLGPDAEALAGVAGGAAAGGCDAERRPLEGCDREALPEDALVGTPTAIAARTGAPLSRVLRRLAAVDPGRGIVECDAAGAILHHRAPAGFAVPAHGPACALWPLFAALSRPLQPVATLVETPDGSVWRADAVAEAAAVSPHGPVLRATMCVSRADDGRDGGRDGDGTPGDPPLPIGPTCRACPRGACPARREPSAWAPLDSGPATGKTARQRDRGDVTGWT